MVTTVIELTASSRKLAWIIHECPKEPIFGTQVTVAPAARVVRAWR
jgi:hypothetical protein